MSVSKAVLNQYQDLLQEIKETREKFDKIETQIADVEKEGTVKDKVTGGEGGWQHFQIEGFPYPEYSKKKTLLYARKAKLECMEVELMETINAVEEFISSVNDSHIRRIINLRFIEGLSWQGVADKMGSNTEGSVKMAFQRFMES